MQINNTALTELAQQVVHKLKAHELTMATAESCTGGWVSKCMTDVNGSSSVFNAGIVTYSNAAKQHFLNVADHLIEDHGAVSLPVAEAMATGAMLASEADVSVAITGIAGPSGGSREKPVGTVCFAWGLRRAAAEASPKSAAGVCSETVVFAGDRDEVRRQAVHHALSGVLARVT